MSTVRGQIAKLDSTAQESIKVEITLVGANGAPVEGYETATKKWLAGTLTLYTDASGLYTWSGAVANANITPSGTAYKRVAYVAGDTETKYLQVPTGAGPFDEPNILTTAPASIEDAALAAHKVDPSAHGGTAGVTGHAQLTGVTADQHHPQAHAIGGSDHTGALTHAALGSVTADQHHPQQHAIGGSDHTGTLVHAAQHAAGGSDPLPQLVHLATFQFKGPLVQGAGTARVPVPFACTIAFIAMTNGVTSSSGSVKADLNYSSTYAGAASTLYSTQGNRPTVAAGSYGTTAALPDTTALAAGSYLTADLDEVGTGAQTVVLDVYVTRP